MYRNDKKKQQLNPCGERFFFYPAGKSTKKMVSRSICSPGRLGHRRSSNYGAKERENTPLFSGHVEMSANVRTFLKMSINKKCHIWTCFCKKNHFLKIKKKFFEKKSRHQNFSNRLFFFSGLPRNF